MVGINPALAGGTERSPAADKNGFAKVALPPVILTFAVAIALGWALARLTRLRAADRRAVAIEVAFQNVALAIGMAVAFFPTLAGVAVTSILWGITHLTLGFALAAVWRLIPLGEPGEGATSAAS